MTIIHPSGDCGNSPKNLLLEAFTIAFANGDTQFILNRITDDILWNHVGQKLIQGKADFTQALEGMQANKMAELTIHHVISHGKAGAVNGTARYENGRTVAFCDVYEFGNAKGTSVKEITSYVVEVSA